MSLKIFHINNQCTGCGACVSVCPKNALKLSYDKEGFYYPSIDLSKCIDCKLCEKNCHILNPIIKNEPINFSAYMGKSKSKDIIKKSSSGGLFASLAQYILNNDGIVFGASYNFEKERLEQTDTDHVSLLKLQKSKYIESYVGDSFKKIKDFLREGRLVMYCGTPCQVSGLRTYLRKIDQTKLLLVDFICHGVPSNKNFTIYKNFLEKKEKYKIVNIDFRPKTLGWRSSNLLLDFENRTQKDIVYQLSYYYSHFQNNDFLRKSCYNCNYCQRHLSDMTIADFWGIINYKPAIDDNKGLSLIIINSPKGKAYLEKIKRTINIESLPISAVQYAYKRNEDSYSFSKRSLLSEQIIKKGFIAAMRHLYLKYIMYVKIRKFIGDILRCLKIKK